MARIKLAAANMVVRSQDKAANLETILSLVDEAAANDVRLLVLPEVALQGYLSLAVAGSVEASTQKRYYQDAAETVPGPTTELLRHRARQHEMFIQLGMAEKIPHVDVVYNTAVIVGPDGVVGLMRKVHNQFEYPFFSRGSGLPVFGLPFGRVGPFICSDLAYPEVNRIHALQGAHMCTLSTAWPMEGRDYDDDPLGYYYDLMSRANAAFNQVWMVAANHCEQREDLWYYGHSRIINPNGRIVAELVSDAGLVIAEVDVIEGVASARTEKPLGQSLLSCRCPEEYGLISDVAVYRGQMRGKPVEDEELSPGFMNNGECDG